MKDKIIAWFKAHPDEYFDVWTLHKEVGGQYKDVRNALVQLEHEYIFKTRVLSKPIGNAIRTIKDKEGNILEVIRAEQPVNFYKWTGVTIHEQNMKNLKLK